MLDYILSDSTYNTEHTLLNVPVSFRLCQKAVHLGTYLDTNYFSTKVSHFVSRSVKCQSNILIVSWLTLHFPQGIPSISLCSMKPQETTAKHNQIKVAYANIWYVVLTYKGFSTLLVKVKILLNACPFTPLPADPSNFQPLNLPEWRLEFIVLEDLPEFVHSCLN